MRDVFLTQQRNPISILHNTQTISSACTPIVCTDDFQIFESTVYNAAGKSGERVISRHRSNFGMLLQVTQSFSVSDENGNCSVQKVCLLLTIYTSVSEGKSYENS